MNSEVLLLGVIVGSVNYLFRYLPLRLAPTLIGFLVLGAAFWKTRSIIVPTLLSALAYGLAWKITSGL